MHLRNVFLLIPKYVVAFAAEVRLKDVVLRLVEQLRDSGTANDALATEDAGRLTKEQRAQRARELAQARADQVNALSALVPVYSDTVLAYTRAFQELAVSVEAVSPRRRSNPSASRHILIPLLSLTSAGPAVRRGGAAERGGAAGAGGGHTHGTAMNRVTPWLRFFSDHLLPVCFRQLAQEK